MALNLGNNFPHRLCVGGNLAQAVYKGSSKEWERAADKFIQRVSPYTAQVGLDVIRGNSIVWNQLARDSAIATTNSTRTYADGYTPRFMALFLRHLIPSMSTLYTHITLLADQPRAESKRVDSAFVQILLGGLLVVIIGFHTAVAVNHQDIQAGTVPAVSAVPCLCLFPADLAVADDDTRLYGVCMLDKAQLPGAVIVVRHRENAGMLLHQQCRMDLVDTLRQFSLRGCHDRLHRFVFGSPDLRHAVFPDLLFVVLFPHPGDPHRQVL